MNSLVVRLTDEDKERLASCLNDRTILEIMPATDYEKPLIGLLAACKQAIKESEDGYPQSGIEIIKNAIERAETALK